jgi:hypothetical protein
VSAETPARTILVIGNGEPTPDALLAAQHAIAEGRLTEQLQELKSRKAEPAKLPSVDEFLANEWITADEAVILKALDEDLRQHTLLRLSVSKYPEADRDRNWAASPSGPLAAMRGELLIPHSLPTLEVARAAYYQLVETQKMRELSHEELHALRRLRPTPGVHQPSAVHEFKAIAKAKTKRERRVERLAKSIAASTMKNPNPDLSLNPKVRAARLKKLSKAARRARRHQLFGRGKRGAQVPKVTMVHQPPMGG